jgi:glycosyltransferase domain-containing protein
MAEQPPVAIIIPTKNRSDLLIRQLSYYASSGCRLSVYVGDSSDEADFEQTAKAVQRLRAQVNIVHMALPGRTIGHATSEMLHVAKEPYAAFSGDDDFLVPESLGKCAQFLEANPDYATAHGFAAICFIQIQGGHRKVTDASHYVLRFSEGATARDRLRAYWANNFETVFSVHRTEDFRSVVDAAAQMPDNGSFNDLNCSLPIVQGKSKQLDCFYLVRGVHDRQSVGLNTFDWLTSLDWSSWYPEFRDYLSEGLVLQDGVTMEEAREVVKQSFWGYLARGITRDWRAHYSRDSATYRSRLRAAVKGLPGAITTWRYLRSLGSGESSRFTLPALLRRSSPYHADFLPIYQAITAAQITLLSPNGKLSDKR